MKIHSSKKIMAVVLTMIMIFATMAMAFSVSAESTYHLGPTVPTSGGANYVSSVTYKNAGYTYTLDLAYGRGYAPNSDSNLSATDNSIDKSIFAEAGETDTVAILGECDDVNYGMRYAEVCPSCGTIIGKYYPIQMTCTRVMGDTDQVVNNCSVSLEKDSSGYPKMMLTLSAIGAGEATLTFSVYQNYNVPARSGRCSGCYRNTATPAFGWVKRNITIHVYVAEPECNHKNTSWEKIDNNYHVEICDDCGAIVTNKEAHTWGSWKVVKPVSCTENGKEKAVCVKCGAEKYRDIIAPGSHNWDDGEVTTKATCDKEGVMTYTCQVCDETYTTSIAKNCDGTCGCKACNKVCTGECAENCACKAESNDHKYVGTVTTAPKCDEEGEMTYKCTECGDTYKETIAKKCDGTCGCKACKKVCTGDCAENCACNAESKDHKYVGTVTTAPKCDEEGEMTYKCTECGDTYKETIAKNCDGTCGCKACNKVCTGDCAENCACKEAKDHTWVLDTDKSTAATCTEDGKNVYVCSVCGAVKEETVPATGHAWDDGVVTKPATCTEDGVMTYTCGNCGATKTEVIPATEHAWDDGVVTKEPTCAEKGEITYTCGNCGATRTEAIPATGNHEDNDNDHKCDGCGMTLTQCKDKDGDGKCDICGKLLKTDSSCDSDSDSDSDSSNLFGGFFAWLKNLINKILHAFKLK